MTAVNRKAPAVREGETPPLACVSMADEAFPPATFGTVGGRYAVVVSLVMKSAGGLVDTGPMRDLREKVRKALSKPGLDGVPEVWLVACEGGQHFDAPSLGNGFDYSTLKFTVSTNETRGA